MNTTYYDDMHIYLLMSGDVYSQSCLRDHVFHWRLAKNAVAAVAWPGCDWPARVLKDLRENVLDPDDGDEIEFSVYDFGPAHKQTGREVWLDPDSAGEGCPWCCEWFEPEDESAEGMVADLDTCPCVLVDQKLVPGTAFYLVAEIKTMLAVKHTNAMPTHHPRPNT